jgi:hypothetical protein
MELFEALGRISEIRARIADTETFRGFRSLTVGFSGLLGIITVFVQREAMARSTFSAVDFIELWVAVALVSLAVVGCELAYRYYVESSPLKRRLTILTLQQFAPSLVAGGAVTAIFAGMESDHVWMLPGLWAILFSLGVFACCRLLPRATFWVGVHYLATGILCLTVGRAAADSTHWMMLVTFGVGQLLAAGILYYTLERNHARASA